MSSFFQQSTALILPRTWIVYGPDCMPETVSVSSFSMHVVTIGELQLTTYEPSMVVPRAIWNVTGAQPSPVCTSVIVMPVIPAPIVPVGLQLLGAGGGASESTRLPRASTMNAIDLSGVSCPELTVTPVWLDAVASVPLIPRSS